MFMFNLHNVTKFTKLNDLLVNTEDLHRDIEKKFHLHDVSSRLIREAIALHDCMT